MAKKPPPPPAKGKKTPAAPKKLSRGITPRGFFLTFVAFSFLILPTMVVLFFGMLPTIAAMFRARAGQHYSWLCVGGMNLAGVAPFIAELWFTQHSFSVAFAQVFDVFNIMVMYFSAAVGWALYTSLPPIIGIFVNLAAKQKVGQLRSRLRQLVEAWGEDVGR